jgi:hypothetical protein
MGTLRSFCALGKGLIALKIVKENSILTLEMDLNGSWHGHEIKPQCMTFKGYFWPTSGI